MTRCCNCGVTLTHADEPGLEVMVDFDGKPTDPPYLSGRTGRVCEKCYEILVIKPLIDMGGLTIDDFEPIED